MSSLATQQVFRISLEWLELYEEWFGLVGGFVEYGSYFGLFGLVRMDCSLLVRTTWEASRRSHVEKRSNDQLQNEW